MTRFYAFGGYGNAVSYLYGRGEAIPEELDDVEDAYNNWEPHLVALPSPPYFLAPTYRPPRSLSGGPYLLFVETKPDNLLSSFTRFVIYANADGSDCSVTSIWEWELDDLIREDDRRRRAAEDQSHTGLGRENEND